MAKESKDIAQVHFGRRLKAYREHFNLSQKEYAIIIHSHQSYIGKVEQGDVAIGIDKMEGFASSFGVEYYEMANPDFPFPGIESLPEKTRNTVTKQRDRKNIATTVTRGSKGIAMHLDRFISTGGLSSPKTAKEIVEILAEAVDITPSRITDLLTKAPRKDKVQDLPPIKGKAKRYVLKNIDTEDENSR